MPESKPLIAPWSENVRYGVKKFGYHGGVNPQEMVTPIVVLSPTGEAPEGWIDAPSDTPLWWDDQPIAVAPAEVKPLRLSQLVVQLDETGRGRFAGEDVVSDRPEREDVEVLTEIAVVADRLRRHVHLARILDQAIQVRRRGDG